MPLWFTDDRGIEWEVWELGPRRAPADATWAAPRGDVTHAGPTAPGHASRHGSWLCFASATHRRHLGRFPDHWAALPPAALAALCAAARPQSPFTGDQRLPELEAWGAARAD